MAGTHGGGGAGGDEDVGLADVDVDGAASELGDGAGGEGHPEAGNGDIVFLIHIFDGFGRFRTVFGYSVSDKANAVSDTGLNGLVGLLNGGGERRMAVAWLGLHEPSWSPRA